MSEYIIHNIDLEVSPQLDFDELVEQDKPLAKFPHYYLNKLIGGMGNELDLNRPRRGGANEHVPNCVLRNEGGIALIRVHNKEDLTIYDLPENTETEVKDCIGVPTSSYPFGYVVVDCRDGKCQLAIEKTSAWDSKITTIKNSLEEFFNDKLSKNMGIGTKLVEKKISTEYEKFIDQRTMDYGDVIESFTFQYVNLKSRPNTRIPDELTEQMDLHSKLLEIYDAIEGTTTWKLGANPNKDKLKQLSKVVSMCSDNAFEMVTHFRDYGDYTCNESIVAKFPMNDVVISNYKDFITPDIVNSDWDLMSWLDEVFKKIRGEKDDEEISTKPMQQD